MNETEEVLLAACRQASVQMCTSYIVTKSDANVRKIYKLQIGIQLKLSFLQEWTKLDIRNYSLYDSFPPLEQVIHI